MTTLKELLRRTYANLQILNEHQAKQGGTVDLRLLNQIEDHEQAIELLEDALATELTESDLAALKAELRPLLIAGGNLETLDVDTLRIEKPRLPFEPETSPIPAGPFLMGSQPGEDIPTIETPQHEVNLPAYRLGTYPVTNAQYAEFLRQNPQHDVPKRAGWFLRNPPKDKLEHPVVAVSWLDALAYTRWLSQQTERTYRLPTEAEWEKAASWAEGEKRVFPWGNEWEPGRCNGDGAATDTSPVDAYPTGVSYYGCYDMAGNTQEWISTLWGRDLGQSDYPYPYRPNDGREDVDATERPNRLYLLHRGGSFRDPPNKLTCTTRGVSDPDSKLRWRGFRVVLEI